MTQPEAPDWIINVPATPAVHDEPPPAFGWEGISDTALQGLRKNLIEAIVGLIGQLPDIALNLIRQLITMIDNAEDLIFEIINMVLGWITGAPDLIITVIETILAWLIEIPELVVSIINAVVGIITDIPEIIVTIIDALLEWITSIPDLILTVIDTFLSWISDDSDLIITVVEAGLQWLIDVPEMVTSIVEAFLDFITSIPDVTDSIINAINSWVTSIPEFLTDLISAFLGWIYDVPELLINVIERVLQWFTDDNNLVQTVVSTWIGFITEIPELIGLLISTWITWITEIPGMAIDFIASILLPNGILGEGSPLNAFNIFGLLNAFNIPLLPLSHLTNTAGPNLLVAPGFDGDQLLSTNGWTWDSTQGKTTNGSARVTAGSLPRELKSNAVPVAEGQILNVGVWMKWSGLSYTGTPIAVKVVRSLAGVEVGSANMASPVSPATNNATWTHYTDTYTVPAGCDSVTLNFAVSATAVAGQVWFDDATVSKSGTTVPQSWVGGLLDSLGGLGDFIQGLLDTFISVVRGIPFVGGTLAQLLEAFTGQTQVIADNSAVNNQILAAFGPGNPDADDFERSTVGSKWTTYQTGTGTLSIINNHDLQFVSPYSNTAEYLSISDVKALTDDMQAAVVLATAPDTAYPLFVSPVYAQDDIWLRVPDSTVSWATRTGLRCRISAEKKVTLSWFLNGTETVLLAPTSFAVPPTAGASFSYEVGVGGTPRRHVAKIGTIPIMDFTEAGTVSQIGGKRRAVGGRNVGSITQANSSAYKQWTAQG